MIAYVDTHRSRFGVEPICRTLRASLDCGFLTPRAYWQAKHRAASVMRARHETLARDIVRELFHFSAVKHHNSRTRVRLVREL
jgi:hypothetical protein